MIKPVRSRFARRIFNPYEESLLKRNFQNFHMIGEAPEISPQRSIIITPNHFSWWDGFFIDYTVRKLLTKNFHIIMLEDQLRKYNFFKRVGAFSINPHSPKGIKESLDFSSKLLDNPQNLLVFYPQGEIESLDKVPLAIKPGLFHLVKKLNNTDILPAAFRIHYSNNKKPDIFVRFGRLTDTKSINDNPDSFRNIFNENVLALKNQDKGISSGTNLFKLKEMK